MFLFHSHIHVLRCDYGYFNAFVDMGAIAMTGFFLLSGFVISYTSKQKNMSRWGVIKEFYIKRLISIIPLYYTYALLHVVIDIVEKGESAIFQELLLFPIEALGIQSVFSSLFPYSHNGGSWFISCILICYAVYPFVHLISENLTNKSKVFMIVLLAGILLWSSVIVHKFALNTIYSNPFFRCLEFIIGSLIAQLSIEEKSNWFILFLKEPSVCIITIFVLVGGVSIAYRIGIPHDYMLYSWIALPCFVSLLFSLSSINFVRLHKMGVIKYLSALSFSIFLSQFLIVWTGVKSFAMIMGYQSNLVNICLSALVCFCIANIFHYCIEKPSARFLKEKFL